MENSDAIAFGRVRCPRCHNVLPEPTVPVYRCGGCGTVLRAKLHTGSEGDVSSASSPRKGRDQQSGNSEVSDNSEARKQRESGDAERTATSPGVSVHFPKGSKDSIYGLQNVTMKRIEGQSNSPDAARMNEMCWPEDDAAAAAELLQTRDELSARADKEEECTNNVLHLDVLPPPRNRCRPVLKGAPFIICSSCFMLIQMPAKFAVSTDRVRKLRCGSCSAVLSYSYRDPARNKLRHTSELQVDAALLLLEVLEEPGSPRRESEFLLPPYPGVKQVKQIRPERIQKGLGRSGIIAPPWQDDQLRSSSGLPTPSIHQHLEQWRGPGMKTQLLLQELAQRSSLGPPAYTCLREGPDHAPRFKAVVNFNGEQFESPGFFTTRRQAKHAAAEAALTAPLLAAHIPIPVEKPHFTFKHVIKAWTTAIRKQFAGGLHHTCTPQAVCELFGRNDIKQMIMEKILLNSYAGSKYTVICINAASGHGKTSLLRVLYNDQQLMNAFDKRIWIQMSDRLDILMLYRKITEFLTSEHCSMSDISSLQVMVVAEIADKRFLLFLDDADIEDQQFWTSMLEVLNASGKGNAVIMSTKNSIDASLTGVATHSYFLNPLSEENNLMMLQQYSGVGTDTQSNLDLLMVAKRFISMFGANPLKLKAISCLLCHEDTISLELDKFEGSVMPLQLCHDVLPTHLKKCLAFFSLFPEGYIFDKHHLVLQWISHGCVRPADGCEIEDIGVEYFDELLCRSFFQYSPVHNDKDDKFVMHELMYKVVESVSRDKYFKSDDPMSSVPENILHMSLVSSQFQTIELMHQTEELKDLQTFLVVQPEWQPYKISFPTLNLVGLDNFFLKFTSLETLDLSYSDTEELPGSIVGLRNLQYLSVSNTRIRSLPSEVCSLSNLQTLEAKDCRFLSELPEDTKKLSKLRHLDLTKELGHVNLPHGIGLLTELRTLPVFHANGDPSRCSIGELRNLNSLKGCLWLSGLESVKSVSNAEEANLKDKHHLKDLTLQWHDDGINIDDEDEDAENVAKQVLESLQPHSNLQELAIRGYQGRSFPAWMQGSSTLPNLVSLTLDGCCNCTQFPAISQLPSLKFLSVRKMYDVQILINDKHCMTKFPSLELLNLWEMYGLEELFEASFGDCPRLRKVCISRCPDLKRLPCTPSLTELVLHYCGQHLPAIPELVSLVSLKIEGFHGVKSFSLPAAAALPALKKLEIRSCKELSLVHGLSALTNVQRLKIAGCPKLVLPSAKN